MKIRSGFVSNSSSSSFIVDISDVFMIQHMPEKLKDTKTLYVPYIFGGEFEFGRQRQNYKDFGSRLNWAYMQAKYAQNAANHYKTEEEKYRAWSKEDIKFYDEISKRNDIQLLEEVLKEHLNIDKVEWKIRLDAEEYDGFTNSKNMKSYPNEDIPFMGGYIDHQSINREEDYNKIFGNKETIFNWLFGVDNYVACRSDEYDDADDLEVDHRQDYVEYILYKD